MHEATAGRGLGVIANSYVGQAITQRVEQPDTSRATWITALAWYEVAGIRGDSDLNELGLDIAAREGVKLTVEERAEVLALAQDVYEDLEKARSARGISPYDNTPADPAMVYPDLKNTRNRETPFSSPRRTGVSAPNTRYSR